MRQLSTYVPQGVVHAIDAIGSRYRVVREAVEEYLRKPRPPVEGAESVTCGQGVNREKLSTGGGAGRKRRVHPCLNPTPSPVSQTKFSASQSGTKFKTSQKPTKFAKNLKNSSRSKFDR